LDDLENDEMPVTNFNLRPENSVTNYNNFDEMFSSMLNNRSDEIKDNMQNKIKDQIVRKKLEEKMKAVKENSQKYKLAKAYTTMMIMKKMKDDLHKKIPLKEIAKIYSDLSKDPKIRDRETMVNFLMKTQRFKDIMESIKEAHADVINNLVYKSKNKDDNWIVDDAKDDNWIVDDNFVNNILFNDPKLKMMYRFERKNDLAEYKAAIEEKKIMMIMWTSFFLIIFMMIILIKNLKKTILIMNPTT
jgi:hypothetical protein